MSDKMIKENSRESGNSRKGIFIAVSFFTLVVMFTADLFPLPKSGYIDIWSMCNWGLTYDTGFIVRGLAGTLLKLFVGTITFKQVYLLSAALYFMLAAVFVFININIIKKSKSISAFLFILFLISQPSNVRWFINGQMFARLDSLVVLIAILCIFVAYKTEGTKKYFILVPVSFIAIMIHEVFAVAFGSLLFALLFLRDNRKSEKINLQSLYFYYIPILVFFVAVILLGKTDLSREKFTLIMQQNLEESLRDGMISVARDIVVDDLSMKVERVQYLFTDDTRNLMILTYVVLSPTIILFGGLFVKFIKQAASKMEKISLILVMGSCLAPLTSSLFGCDHFRWIGYFIMCLSAAIIFLYFLSSNYRTTILEYFKDYAIYFIIASVIGLAFGTLRNMQTMQFLEKIYYNRILVIPEFFK